MLVLEKAKALVLKLNHPGRVLETIPSAQAVHLQGHDVVVVPHKVREVAILRRLGIEAPSPIEL